MKRIATLFSVIAMTLVAQAQNTPINNYIGLNLGGGMNTMAYSPADGQWSPRLGCLAELKYMHFFDTHFGYAVGMQVNWVNAASSFDYTLQTANLTHPHNGMNYTAITRFNDWKEGQSAWLFGIPVEFYWRAQLCDSWEFKAGIGFQLDMAFSSTYNANDGSFEVQGYVPATNVTYSNMPEHGFTTYAANEKGDITNMSSLSLSLIADLGFDTPLSDSWNLYLGIYGGYGLTNLISEASKAPITESPTSTTIDPTATALSNYQSVFGSNQVNAAHLLNAGVKVGISRGWNCRPRTKSAVAEEKYELTPKQTEPDPAKVEEKTVHTQDTAQNLAVKQAESDERVCDARYMRDTNLLRAVDSIDYDLAEAEQMVSETSGEEAHAIVATAKIKAADAKEAYQNGKYCKAYHIYMDTYGHLAECYASAARDFANQADDSIASRAADMATVYAASALTGGLDVAISSTRNSKMYAEAARVRMQEESEPDIDYNDPNLANDLAIVAQRYAELAKSKLAATDAKDASGKAYMGSYANSYAASAKSFYETTEAFNAMCSNEESSAALAEARQYANESAAAARDGKTEDAFINALLAQECAERAGRSCNQKDIERAKKERSASEAPLARNELQQKIDEINATVHFNFASANPRFDEKTDDVITEMCNSLAADKDRKVIITGHTDNVGSAAVNRKYGMKRARALKRLMVKRGAPAKQISCKSKGMSQPEVPNSNAKNRAKNRRATIELQ